VAKRASPARARGRLGSGGRPGAGPELRGLVLLVKIGDFGVGDLLRDLVDKQPTLRNEVLDLGPMRLAEPGLHAAGIGKLFLVLVEEGPQSRYGGELDLITEAADVDRHDLRCRRLRQPAEIVPTEARGIPGEAALEEDEHVLGEELVAEGLEEIVLRDSCPACPEALHDLVELVGRHLPAGQLGEVIVDRRIADDDAILRRLLGQEHRPHHGLLVGRIAGRLGGISPRGHRCLGEEAIEDELHRHGPVEPLLPQFPPIPLRHRGVGQRRGLSAVLEERREDEERQHGEDGERHHRGLLVGAKDAEASHGTA